MDKFHEGLEYLKKRYNITKVDLQNLDSIQDPQIRKFVKMAEAKKENESSANEQSS